MDDEQLTPGPHFVAEDSAGFPEWLPSLPGERLLTVEAVPFHAPENAPTLEELVCVITGATTIDEVGKHGMAIASKAFDHTLGEGAYEAEFARDALVMAAFTDDLLPRLTEATVLRLAELQGVHDEEHPDDPVFDLEEVGRIPHEIRPDDDPIAIIQTVRYGWDWPYYGSVDATPLFISAVVRAAQRDSTILERVVRQRDDVDRTLAQCLHRAVEWIVENCTAHPLGLLSTRAASNGPWQVWADSQDAYHLPDGRLAEGQLAALEVQAFCFDALTEVATLANDLELQDISTAEGLRAIAHRIRDSVVAHMWVDDKGGYFASAYQHDADYVGPLAVRTANTALVLQSALLDGSEYRHIVEALVEQVTTEDSALVCPSGIRTLANDEARFRACGYHTGSVWPWQNYWIALGLRRHGFTRQADALEETMTRIMDAQACYPEYVQGHEVDFALPNEASVMVRTPDGRGGSFLHHAMQPAQKFQGWTIFGAYAVAHRQPR